MVNIEEVKITKSNRKSIAIVILPNGTIEVRAPKYIPNFFIKQFIKSKSDWIKNKQDLVAKNKPKTRKFENYEKFMYLGEEYVLELGNYVHIEISDNKLLFPLGLAQQGKAALEKWYIKQAKNIIKNQVEHYAKALGTSYESISFSDTRSKWGSCTHDNRLQFNWRLIMAPLLVVRYVVIHELVHTTNKNHSHVFWNKVRLLNPSYKQQIKWLKLHGNKLHI